MKNILKSIIAFKLGFFARIIIHRYRPRIVMVTGSVGKTSTKDAIAEVLARHFYIRKSEKSFNSEFGVPFTIFGVENPWGNPFAWFRVMKNILALLVLPNHYPNMLVLEIGADRPCDISRILRFVTPDVVVVTRLPNIPVHVEAYSSPEAVREEEFSPAYALRANTSLIIPADDSYAIENAASISSHIISYGIAQNATVRISHFGFSEIEGKVIGMQATVHINGEQEKLLVTGSVGVTQLLPAAAAIAAAHAFNISLSKALLALQDYEPPPGRGRLLSGKNNSTIIDDSYNSSPVAVEEALATLKAFPYAGRRIAILGDMLELGRYSVKEHERIATIAADSADMIVAVGIRARAFTNVSKNVEVLAFCNSNDAALALPDIVREGDVILVKGSQSIRTERIVEALLANPSDITKIVRQEKKWKQ
ncbi:MAG: UDP-N-acetylmuramoyl-tripeptide--D-alanyl-D-alanine ligase, partial [bacterium]